MKKLIIIILLIFSITACQDNSTSNEATEEFDFPNLQVSENVSTTILSDPHITVPGGFCYADDEIYISDLESSEIYIFDYDFNYKSKFEIKDVELNTPESMVFKDDKLIIADNSNSKLYILNKSGSLLSEFSLEVNGERGKEKLVITDMETMDDSLFMACRSTDGIYRLDLNTGDIVVLSKSINGSISKNNNIIYAADFLQITNEEVDDDKTLIGKAGINAIHIVEGDDTFKLFEIQKGYAPLDFLMTDDLIYIFSGTTGTLIELNSDGIPQYEVWNPYLALRDYYKSDSPDIKPLRNIYSLDYKTFYLVFYDIIVKVEV